MPEQLYRKSMVTVVEQGSILYRIMGYDDDAVQTFGLRIGFKVKRSITPVGDNATVQIYNLSPSSRAQLAQRNVYLTRKEPIRYLQVHAGYVSNMGAIFNGVIIRVVNQRDGADWITTIEASAALAQAFSNSLEKSWKTLTPVQDVIKELFKSTKLGDPVFSVEATAAIAGKFMDSFVTTGSAYESLKRVIDGLGLTWSPGLKGIVVTKPGDPKDATKVFKVSENTGLIGSPKVTDMGADIRMLIDPRISPGILVEVESETLDASTVGLNQKYTVWSVNISGDTHTNDWYMDMNTLYYPPVTSVMEEVLAQPNIIPPDPQL